MISITDGQLYTNKRLFLDSIRPAIDSGLSVSRIGSNAQCKLIKVVATGIKNELTNYRLSDINLDRLNALNTIFYQDFYFISSIEITLTLLLLYRNHNIITSQNQIHYLFLLIAIDYLYLYYILFITKTYYTLVIHLLLASFISFITI